MATLVGVFGVPHNPLLWRAMRPPYDDDLVRTATNFARFADEIEASRAETLIIVGSDHFRQFFYDNSPAIIIGKAPHYEMAWENEIRTFGLEPGAVDGDVEIAEALLGTSHGPEGFDFSFSNEWLLDHAYSIPLRYLTPKLDLAVVPVHTNTNMPPIPHPTRFAALGRYLREAIAASPVERRVAIVTTGHLATDLGGPKQFLGGASPDPEFDADGVRWLREGLLEEAIAGATYDRMKMAGNVTLQYLNFLTALTAAGGHGASFADGTLSRFAGAPFFSWEVR